VRNDPAAPSLAHALPCQYYDPREWCRVGFLTDGGPTPTNQQQDSNEFAATLLDRLEYALKGTAQAGLVDAVCTGSTAYQKACTKCGATSYREEPFLMLKLEIKAATTVQARGRAMGWGGWGGRRLL
jgi:hypothetical protein